MNSKSDPKRRRWLKRWETRYTRALQKRYNLVWVPTLTLNPDFALVLGFIFGFLTAVAFSLLGESPRLKKLQARPEKQTSLGDDEPMVLDVLGFLRETSAHVHQIVGVTHYPSADDDFEDALKSSFIETGLIRLNEHHQKKWLSRGKLPRYIAIDDVSLQTLNVDAQRRFINILL